MTIYDPSSIAEIVKLQSHSEMEQSLNLKKAPMVRKQKYPFPLVEVNWKDAQTAHGWEHEEDLSIEIPVVVTVGFLIKENDDGVLIASSVGTDRHSNARIVIPKGMIVSRKDL